MALSAQLRLWQLKTQRLSKEEKGGLKDFIRENRTGSGSCSILNTATGKEAGHENSAQSICRDCCHALQHLGLG
jgi:hypothetical protein